MATLALTINEAVAESRIGRTRLYESIRTGALPCRKLGKKSIILRSDLEAFSLPTRATR
jgi:Helix-turn-helix domain